MRITIPTTKIKTAAFEIWLPDQLDQKDGPDAKGIITLVPGSNGDGRTMVDHPGWQAFATANNMALLGCYFQDKDPTGIEGYCRAGEESGESLLWAIREYAKELEMPTLEWAPLFLWGFSAGGQFAYEMNAAFPQRVGAFVANKGGIYYTALVPELARITPGLFFTGKKDDEWRQQIIKGLVAVNRRGGAKWLLVQENVSHEVGESVQISMKLFEDVLKGMGN